MPETITAFNEFTAASKIISADMNTNFDNVRGTRLPLDPTAGSAVDNSYNLGSSTYRWADAFMVKVNSLVWPTSGATAGAILYADSATGLAFNNTTTAHQTIVNKLLPTAVNGDFLQYNGTNWVATASGVADNAVITTGSMTIADGDGTQAVFINNAATATVTLPTLADNLDRELHIVGVAGVSVIIDGEGAETINGDTTKRSETIYEGWHIKGETSEWRVLGHYIFSSSTSFTPTPSASTNISVNTANWFREGELAKVSGVVSWNGDGTGTSFSLSVPLSGMDTSKLPHTTSNDEPIIGHAYWDDSGIGYKHLSVVYDSSTTVKFVLDDDTSAWDGSSAANADYLNYSYEIPMLNWEK